MIPNFNFNPMNNQIICATVKGYNGALNFKMPPGVKAWLADDLESIIYEKTTDMYGNDNIRIFKLEEVFPKQQSYVSQEEFLELKQKLEEALRSKNNESTVESTAK